MSELSSLLNSGIHPGIILVLGASLIPLFGGKLKKAVLVLIPAAAFISLMFLPHGAHWGFDFLGYELIFGRVDNLSLCFGYIFTLMATLGMVYSLHLDDDGQHISALLYVGSALGVVFTGDYFTLFICWEIMALASLMLIWYKRDEPSRKAGYRYIMVHAFGGSVLLAGIIMQVAQTGSIAFDAADSGMLSSNLILLGFLVNAAVPPLHAWLSDAYPEGTVTGAVFLSAFTTKTAVYVLIRGYPGWEILIWLGTIMSIYGIIYAILENDMRRILAYSIINQVGFMVAGVGIGTALSLNGSTAHAFGHILYKGLLWMSAGAVLYMTGKRKCTELGGLYKSMPLTLIFCLIGAASISAFPLFSGFTTKSMIISAAANQHLIPVFMLLQLASAGVFLHAGIKFPYFVFFAKDSGIRTTEPPKNMLYAMGGAAFLCILLGVYPQLLYNILPAQIEYNAYTIDHVVQQLELLFYSALAFFVMLPLLKRKNTISLDTDWFYRKLAKGFMWYCEKPLTYYAKKIDDTASRTAYIFLWFTKNPVNAIGVFRDMLYVTVLEMAGSDKAGAFEKRIEQQKALHFSREEQITIGMAVFLLTIILLIYLLIYTIG
ncbi:MAG: Na(+)/H(+) antiporter subunit D [Candidatus Altiarchaeales archaeon ex4484_96]|nr:MAG: Na(+)/H(+) antiporter subunit D [Candidatus Altiarchaeales archaeon ex4484_96]